MEAADFWNDPEVSQKKMKELKSMKDDVATYASLTTQFEDIETLIEMGYEENDATLIPEIEEMLTEFTTTYDAIRAKTLLSGEYDGDNAIVSLHAGAGGTESCDWAAMLYRMYTRWADDKIQRGSAGLPGRRGSRHQVRDISGKWRKCLRLSEIRKRCAPSGAYLAVQCGGKETDLFCVLRCHAGYRGRSGCGDQ